MTTNKNRDGKEMFENDEWVCGDCGTRYPADIHGCVNPDLDRLALNKLNQGRQEVAAEYAKQLREILDAVAILSRYGQVTVNAPGLRWSDG